MNQYPDFNFRQRFMDHLQVIESAEHYTNPWRFSEKEYLVHHWFKRSLYYRAVGDDFTAKIIERRYRLLAYITKPKSHNHERI